MMQMQYRTIPLQAQKREADSPPVIEGYFAVFGSDYHIAPGMVESIAPGAFTDTLDGDIRALIDHDSRLVLGRTTAGTLELEEDEHGLWGRILINPDDTEAMNLYHRTLRGDVSQCSFGFTIDEEDTEVEKSGDVRWTIKKVHLFEVSCCTFPAYEETAIAARSHDKEEIEKRAMQAWRTKLKSRLKGGN